jgi:hypothetical protein
VLGFHSETLREFIEQVEVQNHGIAAATAEMQWEQRGVIRARIAWFHLPVGAGR